MSSAPGSPPAPVEKGRRLQPEARRAQIIEVAREAFSELGVAGTRVRLIAERAGITEPHFYHYFRSKDEIYQLAVLDPLDELVNSLTQETQELARRSDVGREELLQHFHEILLGHIVAVAPLIGASIFGNNADGTDLYLELLTRVRAVITQVVPDLSGWQIGDFDVDVMAQALVGVYLGVSLINLLDGSALDTADVSRQLVTIFAPGIVRPEHRRRRDAARDALPEGLGKFALNDQPLPVGDGKLPKAQRLEQIRHAAREVFLESGFGATRSKDIADRAGITESFLYRLVDSKDQLYDEAVRGPLEEGFAEFAVQVRLLARSRSGQEFVEALIELGIAFFLVYGQLCVVALFSELHEGRRFYQQRVRPHLSGLTAILMAQTGLDDSRIDPGTVSSAILGAQWVGAFDTNLAERPEELRARARGIATTFTGGIRQSR